jgi:hypothetical protein
MKRKKLFICIAVAVLALSVGGYFLIIPQKSSSSVLSDRAKEFMQKQKSSNSKVWRNVVTSSQPKERNQEIRIEKCFVFRVPFVIDHTTMNPECSVMVSLDGGGQIAASKRSVDFGDVEDAPDVVFRKRNEEYKEREVLSKSGRKYLTFVRTVDGFEQTGFYIANGQYVTLSLSKATNEDLSEEFSQLLTSLELL